MKIGHVSHLVRQVQSVNFSETWHILATPLTEPNGTWSNLPSYIYIYIFHGATAHSGSSPPHYPGFMIILRHTTLGRTPLDECSARRREFYLTISNTHKGQTSMPPAGFEPKIPASERPQTPALHHAATRIGYRCIISLNCRQSQFPAREIKHGLESTPVGLCSDQPLDV